MAVNKYTTERKMQPSLIHVPFVNDVESTPPALARDMVYFFKPHGRCLDPCRGSGVFFDLLPAGSDWCEILDGRDFYAHSGRVDWIIGNPPFSHYSSWLRHSFKVADNIVYLMPTYKVFASGKFQDELFKWGGIAHIRRYGTGSQWGFPFGHALAAVHYQRAYAGPTYWSAPKPEDFR
jgi:hypothetical protein